MATCDICHTLGVSSTWRSPLARLHVKWSDPTVADRLVRVQATIPLDSALPEDAVQNTWYFDDDDDPVAGFEDTAGWISSMLTTFYQAIDGMFSPAVAGTVQLKMYDMRDPEPRVAKATDTITITPGPGAGCVAEQAICLSFAATPVSGQPPARRRGRVYLGPVNTDAQSFLNAQQRVGASWRTAITDAAEVMAGGILHPGSPGLRCHWAIFSPATRAGGASLEDSFNDVVSGWVDDAFDTQRRRGPRPTTRTTFSV